MSPGERHDLLLASSNPGKLRELRDLCAPLPVRVLAPGDLPFALPEVDEDGGTFRANACKKALSAAAAAAAGGRDDIWVLAEDSGLMVDALGGAPGVHSARFALDGRDRGALDPLALDRRNLRRVLERLGDTRESERTARYVCAVALARGGRVLLTTEGTVEGRILTEPRGEGGFGYDPIFFYPPFGATLAEVSTRRKASVSHRGQAMRRARDELARLLRARRP